MDLLLVASLLVPQERPAAPPAPVAVRLAPQAPDAEHKLGWSPKAATVPLRASSTASA
jgi:hypothetical protein